MAYRISGILDVAEGLLGLKSTQSAPIRPVATAPVQIHDNTSAIALSASQTAQNYQSQQLSDLQKALQLQQAYAAQLRQQLAQQQQAQQQQQQQSQQQQLTFQQAQAKAQSDAAVAAANAASHQQLDQMNQTIALMKAHQEQQLKDIAYQQQIAALQQPQQLNAYYDPTQDPYAFYQPQQAQAPGTQWGHVPGDDDRGYRGGIQLPADW